MCSNDSIHRDRLFQMATATGNYTYSKAAKSLRNKCTSYSRTLQNNYVSKSLDIAGNNPKKMWKVIKQYITTNKGGDIINDSVTLLLLLIITSLTLCN